MGYVDVRQFGSAADIVGFPGFTVFEKAEEGFRVVFHEQPFANVLSGAEYRYRFVRKGFHDDHRNELLRKLVRSEIVRAIGYHRWQPVGPVPVLNEMIRRSLAGRIGGVGRVGGLFREKPGVVQTAINLVGRDMMEPEGRSAFFIKLLPVGTGGIQEIVCAHDVGLDEIRRVADRAIDMGFRRQMHDCVGFVLVQYPAHFFRVANIVFFKGVGGVRFRRVKRLLA